MSRLDDEQERSILSHLRDRVDLSTTNNSKKHAMTMDPKEKFDCILEIEKLFRRDPGLFLEKWGHLLKQEHIVYFERLNDDHVVRHFTTLLRTKVTDNKTEQIKIKNRRYTYFQYLNKETDYFSDYQMRLRAPLLYEEYIGKYLSVHEKNIPFAKDTKLYERILYDYDYCEAKDAADKKERDTFEEEESEKDEQAETPTEEVKNTQSINLQEITNEERQFYRKQFISIMTEHFLQGKDSDFDYKALDADESWDGTEREHDMEELYFNELEKDDGEPVDPKDGRIGPGNFDKQPYDY